VNTAVAVGNFSSLKRNIRKYRHKNLPREPMNSDLNISEEWKTTMGAEPRPFMIFDSEQFNSRILMFVYDFAIDIQQNLNLGLWMVYSSAHLIFFNNYT